MFSVMPRARHTVDRRTDQVPSVVQRTVRRDERSPALSQAITRRGRIAVAPHADAAPYLIHRTRAVLIDESILPRMGAWRGIDRSFREEGRSVRCLLPEPATSV